LMPRRSQRRIDVPWYERRYRTSSLLRLFQAPAYRTLASLRSRLMAPNPEGVPHVDSERTTPC
ncbi:MAG TPA: hypothetical protein VIV60_30075, partial [Polyangiaceae bacterium]